MGKNICYYCNLEFETQGELLGHIALEHATEEPEEIKNPTNGN